MDTELLILGKSIQKGRKSLGLSQEKFAAKCGLHRTYICDVERGARNVTFHTLLRIAAALNIQTSELLVAFESTCSAMQREDSEQNSADCQRAVTA